MLYVFESELSIFNYFLPLSRTPSRTKAVSSIKKKTFENGINSNFRRSIIGRTSSSHLDSLVASFAFSHCT